MNNNNINSNSNSNTINNLVNNNIVRVNKISSGGAFGEADFFLGKNHRLLYCIIYLLLYIICYYIVYYTNIYNIYTGKFCLITMLLYYYL